MNELKRFWQEEDGIAIIEVVILIAIALGILFLFRDQITGLITSLLNRITSQANVF